MNPTGKKLISVFLVFSLMMLSVNLYARERRGARLIITKLDGKQTEGELIAAKQNSLLLLNTAGKEEAIDISEIKAIRVVKKSRGGRLALIGLLTGCVGGVVYGSLYQGLPGYGASFYVPIFTFYLGLLGMIVGGFAGEIKGTDKKIRIQGMTELHINETLNYLRKKARIRNYR